MKSRLWRLQSHLDLQRQFLWRQCCNRRKQCRNNAATHCCTENHRCQESRVKTSPLQTESVPLK